MELTEEEINYICRVVELDREDVLLDIGVCQESLDPEERTEIPKLESKFLFVDKVFKKLQSLTEKNK